MIRVGEAVGVTLGVPVAVAVPVGEIVEVAVGRVPVAVAVVVGVLVAFAPPEVGLSLVPQFVKNDPTNAIKTAKKTAMRAFIFNSRNS